MQFTEKDRLRTYSENIRHSASQKEISFVLNYEYEPESYRTFSQSQGNNSIILNLKRYSKQLIV